MKPAIHIRTARWCQAAFTISEFMVATVVVMLVLSGVMGCYLYGLRMLEYVKPKLSASEEGRKAVSLLLHEVRSAHLLRIGSGTLSNFVEVPPDTPQGGNAIEIYPTTNKNNFVRYFWDPADQKLKRTADGMTAPQVIANSVSNEPGKLIFTAEDYGGKLLTNNYNNRVIGLTLQFYQIQYPVTPVGPGNMYDFYQLRTKVTRRTIL